MTVLIGELGFGPAECSAVYRSSPQTLLFFNVAVRPFAVHDLAAGGRFHQVSS